eukprot:TRINITY_DN1960_c0_g1_i2.p1 TRINITY_DN1960_c0_g1~~TRINITY_DN1960_c0_g1_i2.p1  ORF type:complete len:161 (-),score=50.83 TRINITY_DN1960_c0_g1_i2:47-529(-)
MVGGEKEVFEKALPIFQVMGKTIIHQGDAGKGQQCKVANQIAVASCMLSAFESLIYSIKAGLDPEKVLQSLSVGAAASFSLTTYPARVLRGDYKPGFFVEHFLKDLGIVLSECERVGASVPGAALARDLYNEVAAMPGGPKMGTQSIFLALQARSEKMKK